MEGFAPFDPENYEKEIYLVKLKNGAIVRGYPNAGLMTNLETGGDIPLENIVGVKIDPNEWLE